MPLVSRKGILAIAAVIDVAINARKRPVSAKALAARHKLPPRHLVLSQLLFIAGCFTNPVRRAVWFRCHQKNLKGLECFS